MLIYFSLKWIGQKISVKFELFGRNPDPVITQGQDPDPNERNVYFDFSLVFLAWKHCMSTHNAHLFLIEVNWTENFS